MNAKTLLILACLPLCLTAQGQTEQSNSEPQYSSTKSGSQPKQHKKVVTGFSGGMMIHIGYAFSSNPEQLFGNKSISEIVTEMSDLPSDGVTLGLGGMIRLHLLDHIHLGGEGHVSTMPLMKTGSNIRTGWGGALCDYYFHAGNTRPLLGLLVGGGKMRRLYVPEDPEEVIGDEVVLNSSYTTTSFFLLDPYVGIEIGLGKISLLIKADYALPFSSATEVNWSNFVSPSGPRLYVGVLFGH